MPIPKWNIPCELESPWAELMACCVLQKAARGLCTFTSALHSAPAFYSRCGGNSEEKNESDKKSRPVQALIKGTELGQDAHTTSECANCSCRCGCAPSPCWQDKKCDWTEVKDSQVKYQENCLSISISKGFQEQHCHVWHRHSCCWVTSRSLPALFLYFHHQSFDLKLFSYNQVPTQSLKASQNPRGRVANLQQSKNTHPCLHIFLAVALPALQRAMLPSVCDKAQLWNASTWNNTVATFAAFDSCQVCPATQRAL